jgi:hypothetical protein
MAAFVKLNGFVEHLAHGVHNLSTGTLTVALSNTAPGSEGTPPTGAASACVLANVTQVSYTNLSSRVISTSTSGQTSGTYKLVLTDLVLTASGSVGPFRYVYIYNDTPTSPADPLIGYYDYASSITMANGETFTIDFSAANGLLQLS